MVLVILCMKFLGFLWIGFVLDIKSLQINVRIGISNINNHKQSGTWLQAMTIIHLNTHHNTDFRYEICYWQCYISALFSFQIKLFLDHSNMQSKTV